MSQGRNEDQGKSRKEVAEKRAKIIRLVRLFFQKQAFIEVDTPILIPFPLPEAHIDPIKAEGGCLHPSPEFAMKILLSYGLNKIFQITRCFRKEERGRLHSEEFLMLEWYDTQKTYTDMMEMTEELVRFLARRLNFEDRLSYKGISIDLSSPWPRIPIKHFFEKVAGVSIETALRKDLFEEIFVLKVEPAIAEQERPCFLIDYPKELASLAKLKDKDTAERFELYVGGLEIANGFTELLDSAEQAERFRRENLRRAQLGKEEFPISNAFLSAISKIDSAAGVAMGLDRLFMILMGKEDISLVQPIGYKDLIP